jgi:hypothetical protein
MTDNGDESIVLDLLDETGERLEVLRSQVIDTEAIAHAAVQALDQVPEPQEPAASRELSRARSLTTSTATKVRELLDQLTTWLTELQGQRGGNGA